MGTIASLVVEITSKQSGFEKGLDSATRSVSSFVGNATKQIARIGAITAGAMTGAAYLINRSFAAAADNIDLLSKAAERLNTPLGELQKLNFAAALADVDSDSFIRSMQLMGKNVFEAATQGGEAAKVFQRLGVNLQDLNRMSADQQFRKIAEALQKVTNAGERNNIQMQIFGRSGLELTNLLNGKLAETDAQFKKLGLGITSEQGRMVEAFNDSKTVLGSIFDGFKEQVAANVSPAFTAINNAVIKSVENMGGIEKAATNFSLKIVDAAIAGVNAFGAMSNAMTQVGLNMDNLASKLSFLKAGFDRFKNAAGGLSFANKEPTIPITPPMTVPSTTNSKEEVQGIVNVLSATSNGFRIFTNNLIDVGKNLGEFGFKMTNADQDQQMREQEIISGPMKTYEENQKKAAESTKQMDAAIKELTQQLLVAKAELAAGKGKTEDKKTGAGASGGFAGAGSSSTPGASSTSDLFGGKRIPFSTDPAMDAILLKQAQDSAIIQKQFDDAKALRDKFPSVPFGTTGKGLSTPQSTTPTLKIVMDTDGFFKFAQAPKFSGIITEVVANALTDTATTGL